MMIPDSGRYVSRGGVKLAAALEHFDVHPADLLCADLGSHVGGFVDCLLQRGAARVYSVDTSYGTLAWKLRRDHRVVVVERTNAMHVSLPEPVDLVTVDVGWTPQGRILPSAATLLKPLARVITLIKPHYEAQKSDLRDGVLPEALVDARVKDTLNEIRAGGWRVIHEMDSPIRGHGGNREVFALLERQRSGDESA